jgi:hypothetical protein
VNRRGLLLAACAVLATAVQVYAGKTSGQSVDSGSFGIYVNGKRVATESFNIQQQSGGSVANFEFKADDGTAKSSQTAELQLTSSGDLKRYEWHELSPVKADSIVTPNDPFLMENLTSGPDQRPVQQPFLVPTSTMILDNNFFAQRQILAWRYMASGCKQNGRQMECKLSPAQFGVLVPQALTFTMVTLEYGGWEKVNLRGVERDLIRLNPKTEGSEWGMWLDSNYKLVRIVVASENTEVLRD